MTGSAQRHLLAGWLLTILCAAAVTVTPAAGVAVRAVVEPESIPMDGTVRLRVVLDGAMGKQVQPPRLDGLEDWQVITGPSSSSQLRFVNGVSSSRHSFTWILAPTRSGRLVIPSLTLVVEGSNYATAPQMVRVSDLPAAPAPGRPATSPSPGMADPEDVFVRAVVEPRDPFVGQPTLLSYRLYSKVEVAGVPQLQEVPPYPDFLARELEGPQKIRATLENVNGQEYRVYVIREMALLPTASGKKVLPQVTFSVPLRSTSRQGRSFFFNLSSVAPVYRRTLPVEINVRPLPREGRPDDFSGAVGQFRMQVQADRETARTGEALGLVVNIQGVGNLKSARAPRLEPLPDFTPYDPQEQSLDPTSRGPFATARRWEYILVPHIPGRQPLPAVSFSYFDPESRRYETLVGEKLELIAQGPRLAEGAVGLSPLRQDLKRLGADIHFIKPLAPVPAAAGRDMYRSGWFWLFLGLPPLMNLAVLGYRWRTRRTLIRLPAVRRRRARRASRRRLNHATALAGSDDPRDFYRLVAQALTEFVADKFNTPATGLTYDRIAALLARRRISEHIAGEYLAVLEECDCARFSPAGGGGARSEMVARAGLALDALEDNL